MYSLARNSIPYPARPASCAAAVSAKQRYKGLSYPAGKEHRSYDEPVRPFSTRPQSMMSRKEATTLSTRVPSRASTQGERFYCGFVERDKNELIGQLRTTGRLSLRENGGSGAYGLSNSQRGNFINGQPKGQKPFDYGYQQNQFKEPRPRVFQGRMSMGNLFRDAYSGPKYGFDFGFW